MKKNILTVIVLALCIANLGMSAMLIFTVVPTTKKTDALISQVASVIQLELTGNTDTVYKASELEEYLIDQKMTRNLKSSGDGSSHFAVLDSVTLALNMNCEGYEDLKKSLETKNAPIMDIVGAVIGSYTYEEARGSDSENAIKAEILKELRKYFGISDFIVDVYLQNPIYS